METTVEGLCNAMARCQFLPADRIRDLRQRWLLEAAAMGGNVGGNLERFTAWLVLQQVATEHQIAVISRGNGQQLFLGPYRISERIGKGRMAGVYKATHTTGVTVAVKVLPPSKAAKRDLLARFQREVKLALSVKHPNVVRSFHTAEHKGLHYLVMEHLEGETLEDVLERRRKLPVGEAVSLVHQALLGLQAIHEQNLVHRDLKPANLMLVGSQPQRATSAALKILDLGMGRALFDDEEGPPQFDLTRPGEMLGSAAYLSPEQAKDAHNIDIRSDIYSLGCVLYHALAGEPPFADVSHVRQLLRHATEAPRPITQHTPEVPSGVQQVLEWMLAKDPAKRYPTPARAAQALEMFFAANNVPPPADDRLGAYLQWVDTFDSTSEALAALANAPTLVAQPAPAPGVPVARPVGNLPPTVTFEEIPEAAVLPGPVHEVSVDLADARTLDLPQTKPPRDRKGPPPLPGRKREESPRGRKNADEPIRMRRKPDRGEDEDEDEEDAEPARMLGMRPRELMVLTIGLLSIFALGVLGLLGWLVYRWIR
jgi:serine/threonine protein kinase